MSYGKETYFAILKSILKYLWNVILRTSEQFLSEDKLNKRIFASLPIFYFKKFNNSMENKYIVPQKIGVDKAFLRNYSVSNY